MPEQKFVLTFDGVNDRIELSKGFSTIEKAITIEFWAKGENSLSQQTSILWAYDAQNARVLNIHLPWQHTADTRIFWDAGNQTGFDRIEKPVQITDYNVWTHWAFVKDAVTGQMYIYQNGKLWHQGGGQNRSLSPIQKFVIGSAPNAVSPWKGSLAEFRIWNQARTQLEIEQQMNRRLVGSERGLCLYLPLDGDANDRTIAGNHGKLYETTWTETQLPVQLETQQQSVLSFDGKDDFISCGKGQSYDKGVRFLGLSQTITLEAWINLSADLITALKDNDDSVRRGATNALEKIGKEAKTAVPTLIEALEDKDSTVRHHAAIALWRIGGEIKVVVPTIIEALKDNDSTVRTFAAIALWKIGVEAKLAVPVLIEALKDNDQAVRLASALALGSTRGETKVVVPALIQASNNNDDIVRSSAALALASIGKEAKVAIPALIEALQNKDVNVRSSAAAALGNMGWETKGIIPLLIEPLKDQYQYSGYLLEKAADALKVIGENFKNKAATMSSADLDQAISDLETALSALKGTRNKKLESNILSVNRSLYYLKKIKQSHN